MHNLTRKYKQELTKASQSGASASRWEYFERIHDMLHSRHRYTGLPGGMDEGRERPIDHNYRSS